MISGASAATPSQEATLRIDGPSPAWERVPDEAWRRRRLLLNVYRSSALVGLGVLPEATFQHSSQQPCTSIKHFQIGSTQSSIPLPIIPVSLSLSSVKWDG